MRDIVRLASVTVAVPDPAATADYLTTALEFEHRTGDGAEHLTAEGDYGLGAPPSLLTLVEGDELRLRGIRLEWSHEHGSSPLLTRLEDSATAYTPGDDDTVVFGDPDGLEIVCGPRRPPVTDRLAPSAVRPRRLGHVNVKVPEAAVTAAFYERVVGLALSEQVGQMLYFLRAGSDHHNFGIRGNAARANVHHVAFEVGGWDYYRPFCDRLASLGHVVEYGPGRHSPGNNLFVYLTDPSSGLRLELFADMAHIDDDAAYEPRRWESGDRARTMNRWGPGPPQSFLE